MSKIKNKERSRIKSRNNNANLIASFFVLGVGLIAGFFLTMGNYIAQTKLLHSVKNIPNIVKYEGKIAECGESKEDCIKVGSGGQIERLK